MEDGNADLEVGNGFIVGMIDGHVGGRRSRRMRLEQVVASVAARESVAGGVHDVLVDGGRRGRRRRVDGTGTHLRSELDVHQRRLVDGERRQERRRAERDRRRRIGGRVDAVGHAIGVEPFVTVQVLGQHVDVGLDRKGQLEPGDLVDVGTERVLVVGAHVRVVGQFKEVSLSGARTRSAAHRRRGRVGRHHHVVVARGREVVLVVHGYAQTAQIAAAAAAVRVVVHHVHVVAVVVVVVLVVVAVVVAAAAVVVVVHRHRVERTEVGQ